MTQDTNYRFIHLLYVPTMACNMQCKYCYLEDNTKDEWQEKNPLETLQYAVEKFQKGKVIPFNISLHGGEVTTLKKEEFEDLIAYIANYYEKNRMVIESNGFQVGHPHIKTNLYDLKRHLDTIKKYEVSISGSLDLPLKIHDTYRVTKGNEKTLKKILENIELLRELPNKKKVSATIFKEHFDLKQIAEDIRFLEKETPLDMNDFNFMIGFDYNSNGLLHPITEEEQVELYEYMKKEFTGTSLEEGLKNAWFAEFGPGYCTNCDNCGEKFFLLEKNGDIYSCVRGQKNKDFFYGNIYKNTVEEILEEAKRKIEKQSLLHPLKEECTTCKYLYLCKTGCPFVKNVYHTSKSYTCKLQQALYKDWGYLPDENNEESIYQYVKKMHPEEIENYYPTRNQEYKGLRELIEEDKRLKYIYDKESFYLEVDGETYPMESQILKRVRKVIYLTRESKMILHAKKQILKEESPYPNNNSLYIMLLSGDMIKYGEEARTKQAHIMTHQIYKEALDKMTTTEEDFYQVDLTNLLKNYYPYLSKENPNNLLVTTSDLRSYHYEKQKKNAYYHIDAINLPFQNIEFILLGGEENVKDQSRNLK